MSQRVWWLPVVVAPGDRSCPAHMCGSGGRTTLAVAAHSCWVLVLLLVVWPGQARSGPAAADVSPQHLLLLLLEKETATSEPMHVGGLLLLMVVLVVAHSLGSSSVAAVAGKESEMRTSDFLCALKSSLHGFCVFVALFCHTRSKMRAAIVDWTPRNAKMSGACCRCLYTCLIRSSYLLSQLNVQHRDTLVLPPTRTCRHSPVALC